MKKNLRLLCLGLVAATFTVGYAQEDKTSLLKNADMELSLKGWAFDGVDVMGKNKKNVNSQVGFHGMNNGVHETWHSNPESPLGDSYVMQRVKELPAGTYVFGAYIGAAKQTRNQKESNRDSITGVFLWARESEVPVATDNPDLGYKYKWAHSSKFNVAVVVPDTGEYKGYLDAGLRISSTNANYVVWDNATLYYFGDMSEAEALDAMAEIDMSNAATVADTLVDVKMNVDTLANLKTAIAAVKEGKTTAATLWDDSEDLFWNMGLARRSAVDYANLQKHIESATVVANGQWTEVAMEFYHGDLIDAIEAAEEAYEAAEANREEITELRATLSQMVGWMRIDSLYTAKDSLHAFINTPNTFTNAPGKYSVAQKNQLEALNKEVADSLAVVEAPDAVDPRPQDLYPYIARIYEAIENVKSNPIPTEYATMPIEFKAGEGGQIEGTVTNSDGLKEFVSPLYRFQNKIELFRITVKNAANGTNKYFCLSALEFYDGEGTRIELTEENVTTEYDHNTINPNSPDGDGIPALFDNDKNTYFHSAWANIPAGDHYLEIKLPNGGYDAFSFKMVSRPGQPHQFPGAMVVNTPTPLRDAMQVVLEEAKALNPYCGADPGFYIGGNAAFDEIATAIAEAEALIANNGAEADMPAAQEKLAKAIYNFKALEEADLLYHRPEAGKVYRIVSSLPGFFEKQNVEKALTVHVDTMKSLWWENVCADSLQQEFMFEPILDADGDPFVEPVEVGKDEEGNAIYEPYYCYNLKSVKHNLYVDTAFVGNKLKLVETAADTVKLKWLGRGQWNILVKGNPFHAGDHNSGNPSESKGAYGGIYGIGSGICAYPGGLDDASAWFIREMPAMPYEVAVTAGEFKSNCIHFEATDSLTLTADVACAFEGLKLYDLYGGAINFEVSVEGTVATVTTESMIPACAFSFTNTEGVTKVTLNVYPPVAVEEDKMAALEAKLETVLAIAPEKGTDVGQYDDITEYTTAVEAAEALAENGSEDDAAIKAAIAQLDSAVAHLKNPHMPEAGKYYFIYSGLSAFEETHGYNMALYADVAEVCWAQENSIEWNRFWQFEPATVEELVDLGADSTATAFYIKNVATQGYVGNIVKAAFTTNAPVPMVADKEATVPYKVTMLNSGTVIALDDVVENQRIHGLGHGGGANKSGKITYWGSGLETASAWRIVETQLDLVNVDFTEIDPNDEKIVKGIYDLFGRRVVAPTAAGIYIIDGKKKLIK